MLVAAAVCPCPPLLVPPVAAGAAPELDAARTACADAVGVLAAARPDRLVVVGPYPGDGGPERYPAGSVGDFRGFGVDVRVRFPGDREAAPDASDVPDASGARDARPLPASLAVAAWLLDRATWSGAPVEAVAVGERLAPSRCADTGRELVGRGGRVALLVMGDGSACRTLKAPGYLDERAAPFDARVGRALGRADTGALAALDEHLAHELKVAGRAPWQVLAGAAEGAGLAGRLLHEDAPYGVGYYVATWS
ncbi:class III extradiol dioxygenase subunit B-like domain-containing protein [Streptomyces sp. SP18CS02]|uniref:class III extradiol dioxygenase subunit B-like domain-containing protein n=1 Tax=Streptomyces sp. SP18CS02 TaxID=3002531 RepID=UPI002E7911E5|nr:class III extradiol dioxygenase subunit B-like domain-containing protein [Streptomyces sp. SP18CS02]MEE1751681.1 class III extradiol dioxygenase subunit B-like domain-containing protein [Streptomyces sp. SP18CS02]